MDLSLLQLFMYKIKGEIKMDKINLEEKFQLYWREFKSKRQIL